MYNFHKSRDTKNRECFRHENFVKGQKNLLALIAKKKKKRDQEKAMSGGKDITNVALNMARLNNGFYSIHGMP